MGNIEDMSKATNMGRGRNSGGDRCREGNIACRSISTSNMGSAIE